jgi:hypothetical protein
VQVQSSTAVAKDMASVIQCIGADGFSITRKIYTDFNPLNPTGHVMHQQFNIQQLYALPTLYLRVLYLSENKQRLVPLTV